MILFLKINFNMAIQIKLYIEIKRKLMNNRIIYNYNGYKIILTISFSSLLLLILIEI